MLVSIDHFSNWQDARFLHRPTTKKVIEFLKQYIAQYGVPRKIRTDPGTVFVSEAFAEFCRQFGVEHMICPVRDHRGNGKIERLIRTINERLRTIKQIILTKDKSGLSEILYSLRVNKKKDSSSPFEKHMGRKPNTVKSNLVRGLLYISEQDPNLDFSPSDFQDELDSSILVRERPRGSKLEGTLKMKKTKVVSESAHTLTMIPEKANTPKVHSKRDVAAATEEQKEKLDNKKNKRRAILAETTSSSDSEP